jgi:hypothetical protein
MKFVCIPQAFYAVLNMFYSSKRARRQIILKGGWLQIAAAFLSAEWSPGKNPGQSPASAMRLQGACCEKRTMQIARAFVHLQRERQRAVL